LTPRARISPEGIENAPGAIDPVFLDMPQFECDLLSDARVNLFGDDFDAARVEAKNAATERGARLVVDSLDIETVEGAGTIGLELAK
jgi:hypothetical protein